MKLSMTTSRNWRLLEPVYYLPFMFTLKYNTSLFTTNSEFVNLFYFNGVNTSREQNTQLFAKFELNISSGRRKAKNSFERALCIDVIQLLDINKYNNRKPIRNERVKTVLVHADCCFLQTKGHFALYDQDLDLAHLF